MQPTLSVLLPNYNHADHVGHALEAMLSQSVRPLQIIVVDDGSTDHSLKVLERFAADNPVVLLLKNEQNRGFIYSIERALEQAQGDYIYCASADDKVLPGFFEQSLKLLAEHPEAGLCFADPGNYDPENDIFYPNHLHWSESPRYFSPAQMAATIRGFIIPGHTSILKRSAFVEAGGYHSELRWHADLFVQFVIGMRYGACYIPQPLASYTISAGSMSTTGPRQWPVQRVILKRLLELPKMTQYRDVLPLFKRGCLLSHFGIPMLRVMLACPQHWDYFSWRFVRYALRFSPVSQQMFADAKRRTFLKTPAPLIGLYRGLRHLYRRDRTPKDSP